MQRTGLFFILTSSLSYASFPIFTKFIYRYSEFNALDLATWRFMFGVPLMWLATLAWMRAAKPPKLERPLPRIGLMLTGILVVLAALAGFLGLRRVDAGLYVVLFFTYPAMTAVVNTLLGEPLPLRGWVALGMTTLGIAFTVINPANIGELFVTPLGVSIALANAIIITMFVIVNDRVQRGYPTTARASAWTFTGTLFILVPMALIRGIPLPESPTVWLLLIGMSIFGTVVAYFSLMMGNKLLGASRAAIVGTSEPAFTIVFAWLLLDERLTILQIIGAALIIGSIIVLEARFKRRKASDVQQAPAAN